MEPSSGRQAAPTETSHAQPGDFLYSLASFTSLLEPVLLAIAPKTLCEVGVEHGLFTGWLLDFCSAQGCAYTGIDPGLTAQAQDAAPPPAAGEATLQPPQAPSCFIARPSTAALPELPLQDVYFLDGDHNYSTVSSELRAICAAAGPTRFPLIVLHDVGWPCDRRDMYYQPSRVPLEEAHASAPDLGVSPDAETLVETGFCPPADQYRWAVARGGPKNGVLTAVEDFLALQPELHYFSLPSVFGLGFLYRSDALPQAALEALSGLRHAVSRLQGLLALLEHNRIRLTMRNMETNALHARLFEATQQLQDECRQLRQEADRSQQAARSLEGQLEAARNDLAWQQERTTEHWRQAGQASADLAWQRERTEEYWREAAQAKTDLAWQKERTTEHWRCAQERGRMLAALHQPLAAARHLARLLLGRAADSSDPAGIPKP